LKFRSGLGDDVTTNLITLCAACHKMRHGRLAKTKVSES
jgi:predicted HNH restriction endonuclease